MIPGYSGWPNVITRVFLEGGRKGKERQISCWKQKSACPRTAGWNATPEAGKGKEMPSLLGLQKEASPANHFRLPPQRYKIQELYCLKAQTCVDLSSSPRKLTQVCNYRQQPYKVLEPCAVGLCQHVSWPLSLW